MAQRCGFRNRAFTTRELTELQRTHIRLLAVKAHLVERKEYQEMSALFPTFLSLGQRLKRLLASDVKTIWQVLEDTQQENDFQVVAPYLYW